MSAATPSDLQKLKELIKRFYEVAGMSPPQQLEINDAVASVFMKMLHETEKCSSAINLVPRPPSGPATVMWIVNNVRRTIFDSFSKKLSATCATIAISKWQTPLRNASMGI